MINSLSSKWLKKMFVCLFLRANKKKCLLSSKQSTHREVVMMENMAIHTADDTLQ